MALPLFVVGSSVVGPIIPHCRVWSKDKKQKIKSIVDRLLESVYKLYSSNFCGKSEVLKTPLIPKII